MRKSIAYNNRADNVFTDRIYFMQDLQIYKHPCLIGEPCIWSMDDASSFWKSGWRLFDKWLYCVAGDSLTNDTPICHILICIPDVQYINRELY